MLDRQVGKPVTWISAPGGSGKSTLVASYLDAQNLPCIWYHCNEVDADIATFFYYMGVAAKKAAPRHKQPLPLLTPEYLTGVPTFTRRYFEILYSRVKTIILDNYQDIPAASPLHEMIALGLEYVPDDVHVLVLSRSGPPSSLAGLKAKDKINRLRKQDICFALEESIQLATKRIPTLNPQCIESIHAKTEGWPAGIVLMLGRELLDGKGCESLKDVSYDRVFDYFAGEIFAKVDKEAQEFLLKTALLDELSVPLAGKLTAAGNAEQILSTLHRQHFFTDRLSGNGKDYKYHPLFREFLLNRAQTAYTTDELIHLRRKAAQLLEQTGNIEDAARLYCEANDRDGIARMVKGRARQLFLQGRNKIVGEWLSHIPEDDTADPWLLYWTGLCSFPCDLPRTRKYLEKALPLFKAIDDHSGIYLSWAGIVDTYAFSDEWRNLDDCIADFEKLRRLYPSFASLEDELIVSSRMLLCLTVRKTDQPQLVDAWLQRVSALLQDKPSPGIQVDTVFCMSVYYLWKGEYDKNAVLLERAATEIRHLETSPFAAIRIKLMKGIHCWITAEYDVALQILSEGLEISAQSGVHLYDSLLWCFKCAAEMAAGHLELAARSLENQLTSLLGLEKTMDVFFYHVNCAWHALLTHNLSRAEEHLKTVFAKMEAMGTPYYRALWHIGMAQVLFLQGCAIEANFHIQTAQRTSHSMKSHVMEWYCLLIEAWFLLQKGKDAEGLLSLHRGLSLGKRYGYVHLEFYQPSVMSYLCAKALEERIEPEYVQGLIRKLGLTPPAPADGMSTSSVYLEEWPYPIKIYTLGRFEILTSDKPLVFAGKEQKKPLEMLKTLIAFGGRDVPRERVTDALWPDAEGDQATKSFETTLSRLRKLLGGEDYITCRARQLAINPLYCWVDTLALDSLFESIQKSEPERLVHLCAKAISLYKGPFLASESGSSWAMQRRGTQMNRLLKAIGTAGRYYEQAGEWESAAEYFTKGIETDDLAEEFYRCLMICQHRLGNYAAAVRTYNRCRSRLITELGIKPSPETTAVYSSIMHQQ